MTAAVEILAKLGHFQGGDTATIGAAVALMFVLAYWILKT